MMIRFFLTLCLFLVSASELYAAQSISIGCILPLSGKYASFGNKVLQGVELAIERYNATEAGKKRAVRLLIKDSQGLPEMAEKAVKELDVDGVSVIIGPILGVAADSAAKKAQELRIPIITMTQKDGITGIGDMVFRNCITNAVQVNALVEFAVREGMKSVAILHPDNQYGSELAALFSAEASKKGVKITINQIYKEGQTDFAQEIKSVVGVKGSKKNKFDAIFIPDYPEKLGMLLPQLVYYDIKGIRLLGPSPWNSPKLLSLAGDFMTDAVFVDGFFVESLRPHVVDFVELYRTTFGEEPGILEAQAFDTTGIVLALVSEGNSSRDSFRNGILKIKDYRGVSGDITFKGRDADRSVYLLTVRSGSFEEIAGQ